MEDLAMLSEEQLYDRVEKLQVENEKLEAEIDGLTKDVKRLMFIPTDIVNENEKMRKALESIAEYWNRDENQGAMSDALWYILETAEQALKGGE